MAAKRAVRRSARHSSNPEDCARHSFAAARFRLNNDYQIPYLDRLAHDPPRTVCPLGPMSRSGRSLCGSAFASAIFEPAYLFTRSVIADGTTISTFMIASCSDDFIF